MLKKILLCASMLLITTSMTTHAAMTLTSTAAVDKSTLPVLYTCDGHDKSPPLAWSDVPLATQAYALTVADPDAPGGLFYHWVLYNIPKEARDLAEGISELPAGTLAGNNGWAKMQYNGPCPPKGSVHHYVFTLYALDASVNLPAGADGGDLLVALKGHVLQKATMTLTYSRWVS